MVEPRSQARVFFTGKQGQVLTKMGNQGLQVHQLKDQQALAKVLLLLPQALAKQEQNIVIPSLLKLPISFKYMVGG